MIVDATVKRRNVNKDTSRIDVFNPRFKFRSLISLNIKYEGRPVKLFTSWSDIANKIVAINDSKIATGVNPKDIPLIKGMIVLCENDKSIYVHMPEQLIK
jgi:hypothetical protein